VRVSDAFLKRPSCPRLQCDSCLLAGFSCWALLETAGVRKIWSRGLGSYGLGLCVIAMDEKEEIGEVRSFAGDDRRWISCLSFWLLRRVTLFSQEDGFRSMFDLNKR
jgi:hypothetical protein